MTNKSEEIMDVNDQAVRDCFRLHEVGIIIHGHTHRPATHRYAEGSIRYVLGDWAPGPSFLSWQSDHGFTLDDPRA